jgi:hypothetical protein
MLAVLAVLVNDETAYAVLGWRARRFRSFVRKHKVPHFKDGRRTVVRLDRILEVVDRLSGAQPQPAAWCEDTIVARAAHRGAR